ncbi:MULTISPECIES: lipopolysaccharide biosynthesis protein [Clostridium]|uniref:lipopolysaccharide biosynthesis protein n=1 Tax=Clostridium TaxID=1485 RepID=UPI00207B0AF6|nr:MULTISPECIES: polysaccharide biosynthesis C-terminal domain-containing protein [Clostridium]
MRIHRTKNATRNIIFGIILKIYQIAVPFIIRTAMIYLLGIEYLGLNSLFISILQVLNLVELGVGSAMVFSMYKPIAEDNYYEICALMHLYKIYYRIIGLCIMILGLILIPFIPKLISGEVPDAINVYILYLLNLAATVLSYWLFAYKNCLLTAHQRTDVTSKITLATNSIQYIFQFLVLIIFRNYYYYLIIALFSQALTNIVTAIIVTKMYPRYEAIGKLDSLTVKEINQRIKDLFTAKLGAVVTNSVDTVVISAFLGLTILAEYNNYYYIMSSIFGLVSVLFSSCTAGIGNSLVTESKEKNYNDFLKFTFIISWLTGFCTCCLYSLYQPFIFLWVGSEFMLNNFTVVLFCLYYYVYELALIFATYKDAAGIWHEDRFRPLIGACVNLILNLYMVKIIGINGILLSTIISYIFVAMPWLIHNLFNILFKRNSIKYIIKLFKHGIVTIIACILNKYICGLVDGQDYIAFFFKIIISCIVPNIVFLIFLWRSWEFKQSVVMVKKILRRN